MNCLWFHQYKSYHIKCYSFFLNARQFATGKLILNKKTTLPSYVFTASRFMTCLITWYSSAMPLPPSISRACRAISSAFPQEFRFSMEIISGVALGAQSKHEGGVRMTRGCASAVSFNADKASATCSRRSYLTYYYWEFLHIQEE